MTEQDIRHALWYAGDQANGFHPGGFTAALIEAWSHADDNNFARLRGAFPGLGEALYVLRMCGADALRDRLRIIMAQR